MESDLGLPAAAVGGVDPHKLSMTTLRIVKLVEKKRQRT